MLKNKYTNNASDNEEDDAMPGLGHGDSLQPLVWTNDNIVAAPALALDVETAPNTKANEEFLPGPGEILGEDPAADPADAEGGGTGDYFEAYGQVGVASNEVYAGGYTEAFRHDAGVNPYVNAGLNPYINAGLNPFAGAGVMPFGPGPRLGPYANAGLLPYPGAGINPYAGPRFGPYAHAGLNPYAGISGLNSYAEGVVNPYAGVGLNNPFAEADVNLYVDPNYESYTEAEQAEDNSMQADTVAVAESSPNINEEIMLKHPLQNTWTLWYLENDRTKSWQDMQNEITSFDTVEDFWSLYNYIKPPSEIRMGSDYSLFKKNIRPMWEDEANQHGGRWVITLNKSCKMNLDNLWLDVLLCLIGEAFDHSDEVCGAVVNIRGKNNKISIWTSNGNMEHAAMEIGRKLRDALCLGRNNYLQYQLHTDTMIKQGSNVKSIYTL